MTIAVERYRLAYRAVPKAACSSVKTGLALIDDRVDVLLEDLAQDNRRIHAIYPTDRFHRRRWKAFAGHFRFTVVRDPIMRLLSVYTNRVTTRGELHHSPKVRAQEGRFPADPDPDFFFQNLVEYMLLSSSIKHHALHTYHFTGRDLSAYSKIYRTSDLADLASDLSEIAGVEVEIPRFNSSGKPLRFENLSPKTQRHILRYLAPEFEHLGALFPRPLL